MSHPVEVTIPMLRSAFEVLIGHLEDAAGASVLLDADYFWSIPADDIYDVTKPPGELTIGQLSESVDNLESLISDPDSAISFALVWFGDVARAIGHHVVR
ncbi:hypothetical protein [Microbacterium sp.]|uniref:hypothetical protein n=1 Tax=Microbacterium sp. TaxID=51671 RepID=UPI0035654B9C